MKTDCRIMFLRDQHRQPHGCIAITVGTNEEFAYYQLSVLNPADRFNRELARSIAIGRLYQDGIPVRLGKSPNIHTISRAIMLDIIDNPTAPARAVKAAKLWLRNTDKKLFVSN